MPRIDVSFLVKRQRLVRLDNVGLIAGDKNYFYAVFDLCETWGDVENLQAVFARDDSSYVMDLAAGEDCYECKIPWEVMQEAGDFTVGLQGGDRISTNRVVVRVVVGCDCEGTPSGEPTKDWFRNVEAEMRTHIKFVNGIAPDENGNVEVRSTGGGIDIVDDGDGNVTITPYGSVSIMDDGDGNVTIL